MACCPGAGAPTLLKRGLIARVPPLDFAELDIGTLAIQESARMTRSLARVPCTIVTGFLGAGKTTLIRHVLAQRQGRRLAVIVNEFGDVGIDGEILKGCGDRRLPGGEHRRARQRLPVLHGGRRVRAGARHAFSRGSPRSSTS